MEPSAGRSRSAAPGNEVLRPVAAELAAAGPRKCRVEVTEEIGQQLPDLLPDRESFGGKPRKHRGEHPRLRGDPRAGSGPRRGSSLGARDARIRAGRRTARGVPMTTLIRSYRLGHAAAWEGISGPDRRARGATRINARSRRSSAQRGCSHTSTRRLCLAEDFYSAERERWVRSTAATRAETIDTILAGCSDRQRAGRSAPGLRDGPSAHRGDRVAARHTKRDATRMPRWRLRSPRSAIGLGASGALVHPLGVLSIAAWMGTRDEVPSRQVG